jgi:hypothetical protein
MDQNNNDDNTVTHTKNPDGSVSISINRLRKYYPVPYVPPVPISTDDIIDVGKNPELRKTITLFYQQKIIKWITSYKDFSHLKKYLKFIKTKEGLFYVYHLLSDYVENGKANWYDLRDFANYSNIKEFLKYKLTHMKV